MNLSLVFSLFRPPLNSHDLRRDNSFLLVIVDEINFKRMLPSWYILMILYHGRFHFSGDDSDFSAISVMVSSCSSLQV